MEKRGLHTHTHTHTPSHTHGTSVMQHVQRTLTKIPVLIFAALCDFVSSLPVTCLNYVVNIAIKLMYTWRRQREAKFTDACRKTFCEHFLFIYVDIATS